MTWPEAAMRIAALVFGFLTIAIIVDALRHRTGWHGNVKPDGYFDGRARPVDPPAMRPCGVCGAVHPTHSDDRPGH